MKDWIILLVISVVTVTVLTSSYQYFKEELALYRAENKCIAEHIKLGVERKNIYRDNGSCYYK